MSASDRRVESRRMQTADDSLTELEQPEDDAIEETPKSAPKRAPTTAPESKVPTSDAETK